MADTTVSVASVGGDYTTIQAAVDAADVSSGKWIVEVDESVAFDEAIDIDTVTGTPSITNYIHVRAGTGHRHSGVAGTGHARVIPDSASGHAFHVTIDYTVIEGLEVKLESPAASDECIRVEAENVLVTGCILWTDSTVADTSALYIGNWDASAAIDNSIVYGFTRAGLHIQQYTSATARTISLAVDHCTIYGCGASGEVESGAVFVRSTALSDVIDVSVYDTIGIGTPGSYNDFGDGDASTRGTPRGTVTWTGSHNLTGTPTTDIGGVNSTTNWQTASDGASASTQSSGAYAVFTNLTLGSRDFTLLDEAGGNLASNSGTSRIGSEPDSRQDFSVDVTGGTRFFSNVDIGADVVGEAAAAVTQTVIAVSLNEGATMYNPEVVRGSSGAGSLQAVAALSFTVTDTFHEGHVVPGVEYILAPLIDEGATFHEPTIGKPGSVAVVIPATTFTTTFHDQTVNARSTITFAIIDASTTLHTPTVAIETDSGLWIYNPPTLGEIHLHMGNFPVGTTIGVTVVSEDGSFTTVSTPTTDQLEGVDTFFLGGHDHVVTDEEKAAIEASGVGGTFTAVLGSGA